MRAIVDGHYRRGKKIFCRVRQRRACAVTGGKRLQVENPSALILHAFIPSCATHSHARVHFFISYFFITCPRECVVRTRKYCRPFSNCTPQPCSILKIGRKISTSGLPPFNRYCDYRSFAKKVKFPCANLSDDSLTGSKFFRPRNSRGCQYTVCS